MKVIKVSKKKIDSPLLTPGNLNAFFKSCEQENKVKVFNDFIKDIVPALKKNFTFISEQQEKRILSIKKKDWANIQSILKDVKEKKGSVQFEFINNAGIPDTEGKCAIITRLVKKELKEPTLKTFTIEG